MTALREYVLNGEAIKGETIIDAHTHTGNLRLYIPDNGPDGLLRSMDRLGISVSLLATMLAITVDPVAGNQEACDAQLAHPARIRGYAVVSPHMSGTEIRAELERRLLQEGFAGIKLHPSQHGYPLTGPGYAPAFEFASEHGNVILAHGWTGGSLCDPQAFLRMAKRYPRVTLLLGHSGGAIEGQEESMDCARQADNLHLDFTCSIRGYGMLERMVDRLGAERIVFGTDSTLIDPAGTLCCVLAAKIPDDDKRKILGGNALRLFGKRLQAWE